MAWGMIDDAECDLCGEKITTGFELQEFAPDEWCVVCNPCLLVVEDK